MECGHGGGRYYAVNKIVTTILAFQNVCDETWTDSITFKTVSVRLG